jgi:prophage regulatory protein
MRILTFNDLKARGIPYCREQIHRKAKAGEFPAPISLSSRRIAWLEAEIDAWIEEKTTQRASAQSRAAAA